MASTRRWFLNDNFFPTAQLHNYNKEKEELGHPRRLLKNKGLGSNAKRAKESINEKRKETPME